MKRCLMKHALLGAAMLMLIRTPMAAAQPAPAPAPATQSSATIFTLIEQLSADDWQQRNDAQNKLIEIGEVVRPMLTQTIEASDNPEVRVRAGAILAQLDENKSIGATMITLHVKDVTPEELFKQLAEKSGMRLEPYSESLWSNSGLNRKVSIDIDNKPFWAAMQEIGKLTNVGFSQWGNGMRLMNSGQPNGIDQINGACQFILRNAIYNRSVQFGRADAKPSESFSINMQAMIEPKVRVVLMGGPVLEDAVDDKGNSLVPPRDPNRGYSSNQSTNMFSSNVPLLYPNDPGKRIARLKGALEMVVQSKSEKIEIADIGSAKAVSKTVSTRYAGDVKLTIQPLQVSGQQYTVKVVIETDQGWPSQQYGSMYSLTQSMDLVDANGVALQRSGGGGGGSDRRVEVQAGFNRSGNSPQAGEPAKLVWEIATEVKPISIPFEYTDLPMP